MSYIVLAKSEGIQMSDVISKAAAAEIVDGEFPTVHVEDMKKIIYLNTKILQKS